MGRRSPEGLIMEEFTSLKFLLLRNYSAPFEFPPFSSEQLWLLVEIIKQKVFWYFWHNLKFFTLFNLIESWDFIAGRALRRSVHLCYWMGGCPPSEWEPELLPTELENWRCFSHSRSKKTIPVTTLCGPDCMHHFIT